MLLGLGGYGVSLLGLGMLVLLILGVTSRCCAPYCCERMGKTPRPCPPGPCSCGNMVLLDYPMFLALSVQVVVSVIISAYGNTSLNLRPFQSTYSEKLEGIKRLEQISLLFSVFMLAIALYCGVQKYRLLHEQLLPRVMDLSAPTPTVVGAPVRGALGAAVGTPYRPWAKRLQSESFHVTNSYRILILMKVFGCFTSMGMGAIKVAASLGVRRQKSLTCWWNRVYCIQSKKRDSWFDGRGFGQKSNSVDKEKAQQKVFSSCDQSYLHLISRCNRIQPQCPHTSPQSHVM